MVCKALNIRLRKRRQWGTVDKVRIYEELNSSGM